MARTASTSRKTSTRKKSSPKNSYGEKALAYLIVSIVVYGCFIYNPDSDPLDGLSYTERLRAERHAYNNNHDIYDYRNDKEVKAYNRNRRTGEPAYYNYKTGEITHRNKTNRRRYGG